MSGTGIAYHRTKSGTELAYGTQLEEQFGSVNSDPDSDLNLNLDAGPGRSHSPTGSPEGHKSRGRFRRLAPVRRLLGRVWNVLRRGRWHVIPEEAGTDSDSSEVRSTGRTLPPGRRDGRY
eukprot:2516317-Rhodomonas_salina.2